MRNKNRDVCNKQGEAVGPDPYKILEFVKSPIDCRYACTGNCSYFTYNQPCLRCYLWTADASPQLRDQREEPSGDQYQVYVDVPRVEEVFEQILDESMCRKTGSNIEN